MALSNIGNMPARSKARNSKLGEAPDPPTKR